MKHFLTFVGIAIIIASIILGIGTGYVLGFFTTLIYGIIPSVIFFALSIIIENQERIMSMQYKTGGSSIFTKTIECYNCKKTYTSDFSYCPHCGRTQE